MKRGAFLFLLFSVLFSVSYAQEKRAFQASEMCLGPEYAIPVGDFRKNNSAYGFTEAGYNYGIGGAVKYLHRLNKLYGVLLQTGFISYHASKSSLAVAGGNMHFTSIPVKLGVNARYRSFFAEPQFGFTYFTGNNTVYQNGSTTYGLTIGSYINNRIVLSGNYERWNKGGFAASHIGVRVAYRFFPGRFNLADSLKNARVTPTTEHPVRYDKDSEYWRKHKTFKTLGWVSIGVGVPLTLLGFVTAIASTESDSIHPSAYQWMLGSGITLSASGIPFFIFSHKYKKMARK
ncbi:hypothetical protein [Filimonas effusa]|uniref:Outer membrane protein beta-barrel domain-containing protein n=1 Tax=Filimonas effusa TaxID=2508721 RepID=A0A4Q1D8S4_9BACT|nr:hypothetical protein [Filimonas effusa]RXK85757.1 hypothetical protein ESB13_02785 [Filimonas effusa]